MPITNHAYYYSSAYPYNRDEMERNFIRDFVISGNAHADLQRIKGYSPKDILERIHQSPLLKRNQILLRILLKRFGGLSWL